MVPALNTSSGRTPLNHKICRQFPLTLSRNCSLLGRLRHGQTNSHRSGFCRLTLPKRSEFGRSKPLVRLMQEGTIHRKSYDPLAAKNQIRDRYPNGLRRCRALANAALLAAKDAGGFHTMMALAALASTWQANLPEAHSNGLPVFKVLYRNNTRIQKRADGTGTKLLHAVNPPRLPRAGPAPNRRDAR